MKKFAFLFAVASLGLILAGAASADRASARCETVTITFQLAFTGENSAEGFFDAQGAFTDEGAASEVFWLWRDFVYGLKTLEGGNGTIELFFFGRTTENEDGTVSMCGFFFFVEGTEGYEGIRGGGYAESLADFEAETLTGTYEGFVYIP